MRGILNIVCMGSVGPRRGRGMCMASYSLMILGYLFVPRMAYVYVVVAENVAFGNFLF